MAETHCGSCGHPASDHPRRIDSADGPCNVVGCYCAGGFVFVPSRPDSAARRKDPTTTPVLEELQRHGKLLERIAVACEGLAAAAMAAGLEELEDPHEDALDEVLKGLDLGDLTPDAAPDAGRSADERMLDNAMGDGRPGPPEEDDA